MISKQTIHTKIIFTYTSGRTRQIIVGREVHRFVRDEAIVDVDNILWHVNPDFIEEIRMELFNPEHGGV